MATANRLSPAEEGPHALIVVLRVESLIDVPSTKELKTVSEHMELLSEKAWKHTMLLFLCEKMVEVNCSDFFLLQIYHDYIQKKTPVKDEDQTVDTVATK
ncbi:hypothetical protein NFI96_020081, partial [Prochilodus magdalenae]